MYTYFFLCKGTYKIFPLSFNEILTSMSFAFPNRQWVAAQGAWRCSGGISPGLIFRNSLLILLTWGFVSSKRYPTQRELLVQLAAVQESSKSLSAVYRVARWLTWVIIKFPSWRQPKLVTTALFFPKVQWQWYSSSQTAIPNSATPFRLCFRKMVYQSYKW